MDDTQNGSNDQQQTDDQQTGSQSGDNQQNGAKPKDDSSLGDAGKKALQAERAARKEAERKLAELEAEISKLRSATAAVKGVDVDAIKADLRKEFDQKLLTAEIKAAAAGKLADPSDAMRYGDYFEGLSADDADGIKSAISKLLKDKPYLATKDDAPKPWGDVGQGQRGSSEPEPASPQERMARAYSRKAD